MKLEDTAQQKDLLFRETERYRVDAKETDAILQQTLKEKEALREEKIALVCDIKDCRRRISEAQGDDRSELRQTFSGSGSAEGTEKHDKTQGKNSHSKSNSRAKGSQDASKVARRKSTARQGTARAGSESGKAVEHSSPISSPGRETRQDGPGKFGTGKSSPGNTAISAFTRSAIPDQGRHSGVIGQDGIKGHRGPGERGGATAETPANESTLDEAFEKEERVSTGSADSENGSEHDVVQPKTQVMDKEIQVNHCQEEANNWYSHSTEAEPQNFANRKP